MRKFEVLVEDHLSEQAMKALQKLENEGVIDSYKMIVELKEEDQEVIDEVAQMKKDIFSMRPGLINTLNLGDLRKKE